MQADSSATALAPGQVQVWVADVTNFSPLPRSLAALLTASEEARAARFHVEADRDRFRLGRSLLRKAVGEYGNTLPSRIAFGYSAYGKPRLEAPGRGLAFNVSHSGDLVVLAFSATGDVGVDVERVRRDVDLPALADSCFSVAERARIFEDPEEATIRFFRYWCAKEAWLKADGRGLALPLGDYSLTPIDGDHFIVIDQRTTRVLPWSVRSLSVGPGFACAVSLSTAWRALKVILVSPDDLRL